LKNKRTKIFKWIKEHVKPHVRWDRHEWKNEKLSWETKEDIAKNIKDHTTVGIKFRWRF